MAKQRFKAALVTASFPMLSTLQPRTVVNPQLDINVRTPRNPNSTEAHSDYSIPQPLYMENVLPTSEGLQSVAFNLVIGSPGVGFGADQAIVLRDDQERNAILVPAGGDNFVFVAGVGWRSLSPVAGAGRQVTRAYVNGRTFICYSGLGIFEYNDAAGTMDNLPIAGLTAAEIKGIGSSSNYLLAYTSFEVHWSSLVDPLDFVPSLTTGAGFAIPQDIKAEIRAVLGISGGYIVYTLKNAIAAVYTNNARAPFTFKEVSNAGGVKGYEQVTSEQTSGSHYAWTTGGLQKITMQGATPVDPEVSDFLAGQLWESYDPLTHTLTQHTAAYPEFAVKLAFIASRWLVISYGTVSRTVFNYALVFDTVLGRWGKLQAEHIDCFSYPFYEITGIDDGPSSKNTMGFMQADGAIFLLDMTYRKPTTQRGVVILGKFQLVRGSMMTLQQAALEGAYMGNASTPIRTFVQPSLDGFNTLPPVPLVALKTSPKAMQYAKRVTGLNFNLIVEGTFALTSCLMEVTQDGDR